MKKEKFKIENIFLLLSITIGILLIFIVPPFQSPDEDSHFTKSYLIATGKFFPKMVDKKVGYYIPAEMNDYINHKLEFMGNRNMKYTYEDVYYEQLLSNSYTQKIFKDISTSKTTPIAHLAPAIGVRLALFFNSFADSGSVSVAVLLQYARLFSLIVYSVLGFLAIKITPKFKKIFFTILLLPSTMYLRSMVTYDAIIIAFVALSLAKMLKLFYDKDCKFQKKDYLLFILSGYILLNIKTVYSIVFLLMFVIPNKKFGSKKDKIKSFIIMIMSVLLLTILTKVCYIGLKYQENDLISLQYEFVKNNPLEFIKILIGNIRTQLSTQLYWMVGTFGLLDTYIPVLLVHIIYFNLIIVFIYEILNDKLELPIWVNISYFGLIIISILSVYGSMYLNWTPQILNLIGGNEVTGVQGRYFLPYLFMIPLIFSNKINSKISNKLKNVLNKLSYTINSYYWVIPTISLVLSIFVIIERFYF